MPSKKRLSFSKRGAMVQPSYAVCPALNLRKFFHENVRASICPYRNFGVGQDRSAGCDRCITPASKIASDVMIDSNNLERRPDGKPLPSFPHPALVFFGLSKPAVLAEDTRPHFIAGRMVQLNIDGSCYGPQGMMLKAGRDKDRKQHQNRRQNEIEKARRAAR